MNESGNNSSTTSATKAKSAKRKVEDAEETNRKFKGARGIKNEAEATGRGTVTTNNDDDHAAATISLSKLPVDVLIKIVKMLPMAQWASLESVNIHFQRAAFGAWRSVRKIHLEEDFVFKNRDGVGEENGEGVLECLLAKLVFRSPNVKEITGFVLPVAPEKRGQCFRLLGQFNSLQRISFAKWQNYGYDGDALGAFLTQSNNCGHFKEVDISGFGYCGLTTDATISIAQGNDSLKLEKFWCRHATARWLNLAGVSLTTLSVIDTRVSPEDLLALVDRNDRLERIDFSVVGTGEAKSVLTYTQLFSAIAALTSKNLSVLKIESRSNSFHKSLHSELVHLVEECGRRRRLKELSLTQFGICTTQVIDAIASNLAHLTCVDVIISEVTSTASLINLMTKLTRLHKLTIVSE